MKLSARHLLVIDRWFYPLNRLLRGMGTSAAPKAGTGRVAVIKLMGLGSIIRLLSLCKERNVDFTRVVLITFSSNREACHLLGADQCLFIRTENVFAFVGDCFRVLLALKRMMPDWIIDFERCSNAVASFRHCLALSSGASTLSFDDIDSVKTPRHVVLNINEYSFHEMLLKGIELMPIVKQDRVNQVLPLKDLAKIVVNINCSDYLLARRYPRSSFREVIKGLNQQHRPNFYLTGTASERGYVEELVSELTRSGVRVHNVAGEWTLTDLQHALLTSALFISGDSGPLHLAIHLGVPTLAIWGPTRPRHFGYADSEVLANVGENLSCAPCFAHPHSTPALSCGGRISCLLDLGPAAIIRSAEKFLERTRDVSIPQAASW